MKRFIVFILAITVFAGYTGAQSVKDDKVVVRHTSLTLSEFVKAVEKQSRVEFVCDTENLEMEKTLSLTPGEYTLEQLIKTISAANGINADFVSDYLVLTPSFRAAAYAGLGGRKLTGKVVAENDEPLPGAAVILEGSTRATVTDDNGGFTINLLPGTRLLSVSFIGLEPRRFIINPESLSDNVIKMNTAANTLDETVVVGYGTQRKRDVTGAITSLSADELDKTAGASIESSLQGKVPGLNIVQNSGEPGTGSTITLRGASSINGPSEPLYIIDGVPIESENISSIQGDASFSPLAGINVSDIESIEVLRDAASAAIYGSRAANGVIIITTKGGGEVGKVSKPTIKLNHNSTLAVISHHLDVMNSDQFRQAYTDARLNAGLEVERQWVLNPTHPYYANSTDWQSLMYRPTYQNKTDLSVNGSSEKASYAVSLSYQDNDPILVGTSYRQFSGRANFGYRLAKSIIGGTNFSCSKTDYTRVMSGQSNMNSATRAIVSTPPVFSPYDYETGELTNMLGNNEFRNPLAMATKYPITFDQYQMVFNQFFKVKLWNFLDYRIRGSFQMRDVKQESYFPEEYDSNHVDSSRSSDGKTSNYMIENTLEFHHSAGDHNISGVVGQSWQDYYTNTISYMGRDYMDDTQILIQNAATWSNVKEIREECAILSFFGRVNYNYKSRYIAQVTFRADGSSRFGSDRRYGFFPSASFGWRFSDERFMLFARNVLTDGKLRISYGVTGNQKLGNYAWQGMYAANSANYGGEVSVLNTALANTSLGWERTSQGNVGLDLSFFRGRIALTLDGYLKDTDDLLFNSPLASYTGFSYRTSNFGSIRNTGFEVAINTVNIDTRNFQWETNFNLGLNRNKVTSLSNGEDVIYSTKGIYALCRVGEPVGVFYGWRALGVYASDDENVWTDPETGLQRPVTKGTVNGEAFGGGDMKWDDINNDGVINDDDRVVIGDPHPDFTGGFGTSLTWKNWKLTAYFSYSVGNDIINSQRRLRNKMSQVMNFGTDALARWRTDGDVTDFPKLVYGDPMDNFRPSTFTVEDGSYIRWKDLMLTYSFPKTLCRKIHMQNLSLSLIASNLLLWTNYSGYDPEVNTSDTAVVTGLDDGAFPKSRTFGIALNLTF